MLAPSTLGVVSTLAVWGASYQPVVSPALCCSLLLGTYKYARLARLRAASASRSTRVLDPLEGNVVF